MQVHEVQTHFCCFSAVIGSIDLHNTDVVRVNLTAQDGSIRKGLAEGRFTTSDLDHDRDIAEVVAHDRFGISCHLDLCGLSIRTNVSVSSICMCGRDSAGNGEDCRNDSGYNKPRVLSSNERVVPGDQSSVGYSSRQWYGRYWYDGCHPNAKHLLATAQS